MRQIYIIGPGAIGTVLTWHLETHGIQITLIGRDSSAIKKIKKDGLRLKTPEGQAESIVLRPSTMTLQDALPPSKDSLVFVTVKIPDLMPLLENLEPGGATWVFCQNGLEIHETVSKAWGSDPNLALVRCVFWMGATRSGDNQFELRARARAEVAGTGAKEVAELLNQAGLPTLVKSDIREMEWQKAFLNLTINPICALYQVPNGEILHNPELKELAKRLLAEALQVAQAEGVSFPADMEARTWEAIRATSGNINSMAQDVSRGRRTEIDALNGTLVRIAEKHGLAVPTHRDFLHRVSNLTQLFVSKESV